MHDGSAENADLLLIKGLVFPLYRKRKLEKIAQPITDNQTENYSDQILYVKTNTSCILILIFYYNCAWEVK